MPISAVKCAATTCAAVAKPSGRCGTQGAPRVAAAYIHTDSATEHSFATRSPTVWTHLPNGRRADEQVAFHTTACACAVRRVPRMGRGGHLRRTCRRARSSPGGILRLRPGHRPVHVATRDRKSVV